MTSKSPTGSVDTSLKINVKGKYLAAIENYVSTLELGQGVLARWNSEFEALQEDIVRLHGRFLSKSNAVGIVVEKCFEFEAAHAGRTGALSDPNNADLRALLVARIKEYLESLPREYTLRIGLSSFPQWGIAKFEISKSIRIITGNPPLTGINALVQLTPAQGGSEPHFASYIEFSASGYSDWSPDSQAASACLSFAKQCAFILTSHGICKLSYKQSKAMATLSDDRIGHTQEVILPDAVARCFGRLSIDEEKLLVDDKNGMTVVSATGRRAATNEEKNMSFDWLLYHVRRFFEAQSHPDFESIAVAIEWYQDSFFADNQNFSYIAACIGLEALFGSEDQLENMSNRLADRYAFLLGKSRTEREKMIADYKNVLRLRGRLVHSKVARLSGDDLDLLRVAQKMLKNAIWHELYAMYQAKDNKQQA